MAAKVLRYESDPESIVSEPATKIPKKIIATTEKERKWTTKMMIKDALTELKTRKGVSVYAIKKHLNDKFQVDTERLSYVIKKTLKTGVEDGTFVQLKGIGASGSFKLAVLKEKVKKPVKKKKPEKEGKEKTKETKKKIEKSDKPTKKDAEKKTVTKTAQKNLEIVVEKKVAKETKKMKEKQKGSEEDKKTKEKVKKSKVKMVELQDGVKSKKIKAKMVKETPKKKNMMKRKSIGSIRKPPKMKPK